MASPPARRTVGDLALVRRLVGENARDFRGRYAIVIAAMAVFAVTTGGTAWLMRDVVDGIFFTRDENLVVLVPILMGALFVTRGIANYVSLVIQARIGNAIVARLQRRVFEKILRLDLDFFARNHSADLVTRMLHQTAAARDALDKLGNVAIRDLLTLIVLVGVMLWQNLVLSLVVFLVAPVAIILVSRLIRRTRQAAEAEFRFTSLVSSVLQETALGMRVVRAFNLEGTMRGRMEDAITEVEGRANRVATMTARTAPIMEGIAGIAVAGILLWTGWSVVHSGATPGSFIAFVTAMLLAYEPAARLARFNVHVAGRLANVRQLYELLDAPVPPDDSGRPRLEVTAGRIEFDRVAFRYRPEERLFESLSFVAEAGKTTALVGPSGAGKSTIIALIERFHELGGGRIMVDGRDIADVAVADLRSHIALVGQDVRLFAGTVRDNIRFGRLGATDAEVEAAARDALADGFIRALPQGYDTTLGEQGVDLSGGQRQRLAIARALLRNAPIVLLDEATSALDAESEMRVQEAFDRLKAGRTTIVVAHRLSTIVGADRICVVVDGAIAEAGTHRELLAAGGAYARFHRLQFADAEPIPESNTATA
ncbi:MAG: ABC transporter ATP-binding protein [Bauldia sp.]|nr:ABC transporter ATP-binding protein [Bauldia sp.]